MNRQECDILSTLFQTPFTNQRILAELCGHSLGMVNRSLKSLVQSGYLDAHFQLTEKAVCELRKKAPQRAIILAAGFGMRMVPINAQMPKALLEVKGEKLIERHIRQLHAVGIHEIHVVVGFMKEQFEYLIDEFGVELIVNHAYSVKNNLYSLALASDYLDNAYIVPCDIWCRSNPFRSTELYSWYMVSDAADEESGVRVNRRMELVRTSAPAGNAMVGISYILPEDAGKIRERLHTFAGSKKYDNAFWEETLFEGEKLLTAARVIPASDAIEINTYEQLRELDSNSQQLQSEAIALITRQLHARAEEITDISVLKKGMTNRSFLFSCKGRKYIMRIPGEGTDRLIDRRQEAEVYRVISGTGICDDPICIHPENGYKITAFLDGVRCCDPCSIRDLERCMSLLRRFHGMKLNVNHEFDIFKQIEFYEHLRSGLKSAYRDYPETKAHVWSLRPYIEANAAQKVLTHIDAVPDNFLFYDRGCGEELQLTDWEYAGMQDPHVDVAMFCIYALYDREQVDRLISIYFEGSCPAATRIKIYCYIAACGLLWSNWCEYKRTLGVEFGEYSLRQYRYAKEYFRIAKEAMNNLGSL